MALVTENSAEQAALHDYSARKVSAYSALSSTIK
jgi:hypothetical protein